jgi:hypothetical protein
MGAARGAAGGAAMIGSMILDAAPCGAVFMSR